MSEEDREKKEKKSLFKSPRTRLKFSVWVIIANFVLGMIGMLLGADLTALGVFLAMSNAPLYVYVLGDSFRPSAVPDKYFEQPHSGAGGLGGIINPGYPGYSSEQGSYFNYHGKNIDNPDSDTPNVKNPNEQYI
jgi:hypothetical protein